MGPAGKNAENLFRNCWRKNGPSPKWDDERKLAYLVHLAETGTRALSAAMVGFYPQAVNDERKRDRDFDKACDVAQMLHNDAIDDGIRRRAFEGLAQTRFHKGKWYNNEDVREYSDALAALYAKRRNPAYRDKVKVEGLEASGVLVVPARIKDPSAWAKKFERSEIDDENVSDVPGDGASAAD